MEKLRIEYQKMIDKTSQIYATLYFGLVAFFATHVFPFKESSVVYLIIAGSLLIAVSVTWYWKVNSWNDLLKADIEYNKSKSPDYRDYSQFIQTELDKNRLLKKKQTFFYPNYADDLLPKVLLAISFLIVFIGLALMIITSSIDLVKIFK